MSWRSSTVKPLRIAAARQVPGLGFWAGFAAGEFVGWWILQPPHGPDQPKVAGEADLGYRLMRRHWRRGYASEGARELIRYGFDDLGLNRIFAQTMAANTAARATMSAAGLSHVRAFISGPYGDLVPDAEQGEVEYEITRSTWQRNPARRRFRHAAVTACANRASGASCARPFPARALATRTDQPHRDSRHPDRNPAHGRAKRRFALALRLRSVTNFGRDLTLGGGHGRQAEEIPQS